MIVLVSVSSGCQYTARLQTYICNKKICSAMHSMQTHTWHWAIDGALWNSLVFEVN